MNATKEKKVIAFYGRFKYQGFLVDEDEATYLIEDIREGNIRLPKAGTIIKEVPL
jgi:hypothetical protein